MSASVGPQLRRFGAEKDEVLVMPSHHVVTCRVNHSAALSQDDHVLSYINPLNPELNPICYLLALLAHNFLHVSRIRIKSLTTRLLMSYIYIWSTYS